MVATETRSRDAIDQVAAGIVVAATVWYALAVGWNLFATVGAGHDSLVAARALMADNAVRWGVWGPVREYTIEPPGFHQFYSHHPYGTYWIIMAFASVLGAHAYVARLASVLMSAAVPPMLYGIGRRMWGPVPGALAALAYAVLPIGLVFGNLSGFEGPLCFACVLTAWGTVRFTERWQKRWMAASLFGVLLGSNVDWEYQIFLYVMLAGIVAAAYFLPQRWYGRMPARTVGQWAIVAVAVSGVTLAGYLWYFHRIEALEALLKSDAKRSKGNDWPISAALAARQWWIDVTFTPLAVTLGKIALPIFVIRLLARRLLEIIPLAMLVMAVVEYVKFKNGADVHIYWPYPFAPYFALAFGVLAATVIGVTRWTLARFRRFDARGMVPLATAAAMGLLALSILPDGVDALRYGRATGGRFNEKGRRAYRDVDEAEALEWMRPRMAPETTPLVHDGMKATWALDWASRHRLKTTGELPKAGVDFGDERYFLYDVEFLPAADQKRLADEFKVTVVDHFAMIDRAAPKGPVDAYVFDEREPTLLQWYLAYGTEPVRTVRPDAWATWELRDAWGQTPNPRPTGAPQTLEQIRIAHNAALAAHDDAGAKRYEDALMRQIDPHVSIGFSDGTRLLGEKLTRGVLAEDAIFFRAAGPAAEDFEFALSATVDMKKRLSWVPADDKMQQLGNPFLVSPRFWRRGYVYAEHTEIHHRPGLERFRGRFEPANKGAPKPPDRDDVPLFEME